MARYDHVGVEKKWQNFWAENKTFQASENPDKPKYYALDMFPYPSGAGLHVGHPLGYTATDIISRKKRHEGFEVLHPMGWDAFGLPAENYAIKTGVHPAKSTNENVENFTRQIKSLGFSYDWDREINSTDPNYYKWSQWIFLALYKKGLLYEDSKPMNWCPKCKVVAANEEVENGLHERCGSVVEKRNMRQWMFRITDYAERLLSDLDKPNVLMIHGVGSTGDQGWFETVRYQFEKADIECLTPTFPAVEKPDYEAWKDFFEKELKDKVNEKTVIITHSLGYNFLINYLSEEDLHFSEAIIVGPPATDKMGFLKSFYAPEVDFERVRRSTNNFRVIGAEDDPYVPVADCEQAANALNAHLEIYETGGHFSMNENTCAPIEYHSQKIIESVIDWPEKIRSMQRNWIGKSTGINIDYPVDNFDYTITCYTTRPDTNFGATFLVLGPEHSMLESHLDQIPNKAEVQAYIDENKNKTEIERLAEGRKKTGVFTGLHVTNPLNGKPLPVYVGDFVLGHVGTGAVIGVPGHDLRDFEFAQVFGIDIKRVVVSADGDTSEITKPEQVQEKEGKMINSDFLDGMEIMAAKESIMDHFEANGWGKRVTNYKLRDWIFTRQRYWGEPIPLVFDEAGTCYSLHESELPLLLPETANYEPSASGESPLAKIEDWVNVKGDIQSDGTVKISDKGAQIFRRETSTMPNWAGSSWYWLRFMDVNNDAAFCDIEKEKYWGPVDLYVGGAEHAVLHLLYARFWHKALYDLGLVSTKEPFKKLVNQGMIVSFAYQNKNGGLISIDEVEEKEGKYFIINTGEEVEKVTAKMSKSLKNVVNPDEIVQSFGADTLRCYEMFMGPFEQSKVWETTAVAGMRKFLDKIHRSYQDRMNKWSDETDENFKSTLHKTIKTVGDHIDDFKFNTALSQLMVCFNDWQKTDHISQSDAEKILIILSPYAPHLAEELWSQFGYTEGISYQPWPKYDEQYLIESSITYGIQVNGKLRGEISLSKDISKEDALSQARAVENVSKWVEEGNVVKEIYVPGKIIGFVVK